MAVDRQSVDLTEPDLLPSPSIISGPGRDPSPSQDPIVPVSSEVSTQPRDHMHGVVALLGAPMSVDLTQEDGNDNLVVVDISRPCPRQSLDEIHSQANLQEFKERIPEARQLSSASSIAPINANNLRQSGSTVKHKRRRTSEEMPFKPFPFMRFPPEIRNSVYKILLTTPNAPIEFPGLTGQNAARHRARWVKCNTVNMRRRHKRIFLEILGVSRQVHNEASGIIYGCNVFKYRSNPNEGQKSVVLPTRHLQLLKHIKISVVSRDAQNGQREWVADLIEQFAKDGLKLETFELTWYGWTKYRPIVPGQICEALGLLQVSKNFVIKIAGEARMQKPMQVLLEKSLVAKKVEILRPVKASGKELSDDEAS